MSNIRLQKFLADAGIASRRKSEAYIKAGSVKVNGKTIREMGFKVDPQNDVVNFKGREVKDKTEFVYIVLNKPFGYVCTTRRFKEEKNILRLVKIKERVYPVGRLDKDSSGLIILTNDGDFALKLTHPRYEKEKEYKVRVSKEISNEGLKKMSQGVKIEEGKTLPAEVERLTKNEFQIILKEGKKRQIKEMCKALDYHVLDLKRIRIGSLKLGDLGVGKWRYLTKEEVSDLKR